MTYLLYDIKFYKLDENEEPIRDSKGNLTAEGIKIINDG